MTHPALIGLRLALTALLFGLLNACSGQVPQASSTPTEHTIRMIIGFKQALDPSSSELLAQLRDATHARQVDALSGLTQNRAVFVFHFTQAIDTPTVVQQIGRVHVVEYAEPDRIATAR